MTDPASYILAYTGRESAEESAAEIREIPRTRKVTITQRALKAHGCTETLYIVAVWER